MAESFDEFISHERKHVPLLKEALAPSQALESLFRSPNNDKRQEYLDLLGYQNNEEARRIKEHTTTMHKALVNELQNDEKAANATDEDVHQRLLRLEVEADTPGTWECGLPYLFSRGLEGMTIPHVILDRGSYHRTDLFDFKRVKPLIRFLLRIHPSLPEMVTDKKEPPIHIALKVSDRFVDVKTKIANIS